MKFYWQISLLLNYSNKFKNKNKNRPSGIFFFINVDIKSIYNRVNQSTDCDMYSDSSEFYSNPKPTEIPIFHPE